MSEPAVHRVGRYNGWLPKSRAVHRTFFRNVAGRVASRVKSPVLAREPHTPAVEQFKRAIEADEIMVELWRQIFLQVSKENTIPDFDTLLYMMDDIVVAPPSFVVATENGQETSEPIGVPLYLLFDLLSNTSAAYDLFRYPKFNDAMKDLLDSWGQYLTTTDSNRTLTNLPDGWFSEASLRLLEEGRGVFNQTYITPDPTAVNRGYTSWDHFFCRELQPGARPIVVPLPGPEPVIPIYNACESAYERIQRNVQRHDQFWLKGMKYSLYDMFGRDEARTQQFLGGTVYQAFLSPQDYHHWHSPVKGTVVHAEVVPGTYYAVLPDDGEPLTQGSELGEGDPHGALIRSQPWLTVSAARALIFIEADRKEIGLVCVIAVGMAEVSTCDLRVRRDDPVEPGQQLGMFHFGGSSHAVIFGPQAHVAFTDEVKPGNHIQINRIIAFANAK